MTYSKTQQNILDYFKENHIVCAQDLLEAFPNVNKTTIYRALQKLVGNEAIKELHFSPEQTHYELRSHSHPHIICTNCGRVEGIHISMRSLLSKVPNTFKTDRVELNIFGLCAHCQNL